MSSPDGTTEPADQTEQVPGETSVDTGAFTERGEDAERNRHVGEDGLEEREARQEIEGDGGVPPVRVGVAREVEADEPSSLEWNTVLRDTGRLDARRLGLGRTP